MKRSILGGRALRAACACALALGIAPAAAWGAADGEQPASDVDALQEVVADISNDGETLPESDEPAPGNNDNDNDNDNSNAAESNDDDHETTNTDTSIQSSVSATKETPELYAEKDISESQEVQQTGDAPSHQLAESASVQDGTFPAAIEPQSESADQSSVTAIEVSQPETSVNVFKCPFADCMYGYHYEGEDAGEGEIAFRLSEPLPEGYSVLLKYDEFVDYHLLDV